MKHAPSIKVIGYDKGSSILYFDPFEAVREGFFVIPFVEIELHEILNNIYFINKKEEVFIVPDLIVSTHNLGRKLETIENSLGAFDKISMDEYNSNIEHINLVNAIAINDLYLAISIGSEEVWIISRKLNPYNITSELKRLILVSKSNIEVIGKGENFDIFFRKMNV